MFWKKKFFEKQKIRENQFLLEALYVVDFFHRAVGQLPSGRSYSNPWSISRTTARYTDNEHVKEFRAVICTSLLDPEHSNALVCIFLFFFSPGNQKKPLFRPGRYPIYLCQRYVSSVVRRHGAFVSVTHRLIPAKEIFLRQSAFGLYMCTHRSYWGSSSYASGMHCRLRLLSFDCCPWEHCPWPCQTTTSVHIQQRLKKTTKPRKRNWLEQRKLILKLWS